MILVLGSVQVPAERLAAALALARAHCARSRAEPGCISHAVHLEADAAAEPAGPQRLVFVEQWADLAALRQHFRVPASQQVVKDLGALALAAPVMTVHEATTVDPFARPA